MNDEILITLFDGRGKNRWRYYPHRKVYSVFCDGGWSCFLNFEEIKNEVSKILNKENPKKVLFVGICKHSNFALKICNSIINDYPNIKFGVLGAPWLIGCNLCKSPVSSNGVKLTPQLVYESRIYPILRKILQIDGDCRIQFEEYNIKDISLFSFYSFNDTWDLDYNTNKILSPYFKKVYSNKCEIDDPFKTHAHILDFIKNESAKTKIMIDEIFATI